MLVPSGAVVKQFVQTSLHKLLARVGAALNAFEYPAPDFYKYTRLPVTRWVKLSLNFELLVNRVMKFILGQRLFNINIFCAT